MLSLKKFLFAFTVIILGLSIYIITSSTEFVGKKVEKVNDVTYRSVTPDYEWIIEFDKGINEPILNKESLYVTDDKNNLIAVSIQRDSNITVRVIPPVEGYNHEPVYTLNINKNLDLEHLGKYNPQDAYKINFKPEEDI